MFVGCPVQFRLKFPISRDPPEGGTSPSQTHPGLFPGCVSNFEGSPRRGNRKGSRKLNISLGKFPISRDPPEGGTSMGFQASRLLNQKFPISRDPPEGGTNRLFDDVRVLFKFPISRDPPEGGTSSVHPGA